jgi:predicted xylose isomerase-like sugar epimerase
MKSGDRLDCLNERLVEAERHLAEQSRGTVSYKDAVAAVEQIRRLLSSGDGTPTSFDPRSPKGRDHRSSSPSRRSSAGNER